MSTEFEDAAERASSEDHPSPQAAQRIRRFAPRRSRSAALNAESDGDAAGDAPTHDAATIPLLERADPPHLDAPAAIGAPSPGAPIADATPIDAGTANQAHAALAEPVIDATAPAPRAGRRSRGRRSPAAAAQPEHAPPTTDAATLDVPASPAVHAQSPIAASAEPLPAAAAEPESAATGAQPARTRSRSRSRRSAGTVQPPTVSDEALVPTALQPAPLEAGTTVPIEAPLEVAAEAHQSVVDAPPPARSRRSRRRPGAAPAPSSPEEAQALAPLSGAPESGLRAAGEVTQQPPVELIAEPPVGAETAPLSAEQRPAEHPQNGDDLLALALRELFPLPDAEPTLEGALFADIDALQGTDNLVADAEDADEVDDAAPDADDTVLSEDGEPLRRRSRRGRRGGRGRRRNGAGALEGELDPGENGHEPEQRTELTVVPPIAAEPATDVFVPEDPARAERPWRERPSRRQWGRTFPREEMVRFPAPKPANGVRPGPIPQALPPVAASAEPVSIAPQQTSAFVMPDLRIAEPLAPGETRSDRMLEAQTLLLQALLQQQARQIDLLSSAVEGLRGTVQGLASRTYQPRTGIFVDAPNVCYAAENARVNLDYGRMLRYLSKDRHLVHALSYAPITDDVREGIRYETQRFVAPFLRTGYKMITKPLKRFPDGSAKGNFDIELALDIVTMSERLDIVVLVSGDSDFERLIELIQRNGVRVEVVAFASNVSTELVNVADVFIDINQHLEHMRAL